ncbi:hypothetical protein [Streptococcus parauberis]|nr:hypothetical protein [Streptococcus parauberis]UWV11239.1 hypothetical protein N2A95_03515 [Streptococcus parauberis]WEM62421.1 hypothetical protein P1T46_07285 [Streptococcus parauberis]WEM66124.1 hypothetical protein P1T45_02665 [Streptococcus parauberis]
MFDDELVIIAIGIWHRKDNYKKKSNYV